MTNEKKNIQKSDRGIFRVFELFTESIGWLQIAASPLFIGLIVGAVIYFPNPTTTRLIVGIIVATLGLIIGVIWATKQWKGKGTIWFMSSINATPELDKLEEKDNNDKADNDDNENGNR